MGALRVNAILRKADMHHTQVPRNPDPPPSAFLENLAALIGDGSVNAWAKKYELDQTTIQRIVNGQDPKLSTVMRIADVAGVKPWELLAPGFRPTSRADLDSDALDFAADYQRMSAEQRRAMRNFYQVFSRVLPDIDLSQNEPELPGMSDFGALEAEIPRQRKTDR